MTTETIPRDFGAKRAPHGTGWIAWFQAPGIGVRTVKIEGVVTREGKKPVAEIFPTKEAAEIAAARAKDCAEDKGRQPRPRTAKQYRSTGQGRQRRAVPI